MLSANWDEILSESYTDRKIFKWKDHAVGALADPFDHTDIQYTQCFSFSLGTWGAISYIPVWSTGREEAALSAWCMLQHFCQGKTD